jgi:hypothetical protein
MFRSVVELMLAHRHSREAWDPRQADLGRDRRIFQRVRLEVPCRLDNQFFGQAAEGSTVNLSLGGVGLVAPVMWPEGSRVRVHMESLSLRADGLIVFRKDPATDTDRRTRYGVKFQGMGFKDLLKLRRILKQNYQGPLAVL